MAQYSTLAYVLHRYNLGEADRILVLLTENYGLKRVVAKGLRRPKSKLAGHLEPFVQTTLQLVNGRNLDVVTSAQAQSFSSITASDLQVMKIAHSLSELFIKLASEEVEDSAIFWLYHHSIEQLQKGIAGELVYLAAILQLLDTLGHRPKLDTKPSSKYYLSFVDGVIYQSPPPHTNNPIRENQVKLWRVLLSIELDQLSRIRYGDESLIDSINLVEQFAIWQFGIKLRARTIIG